MPFWTNWFDKKKNKIEVNDGLYTIYLDNKYETIQDTELNNTKFTINFKDDNNEDKILNNVKITSINTKEQTLDFYTNEVSKNNFPIDKITSIVKIQKGGRRRKFTIKKKKRSISRKKKI